MTVSILGPAINNLSLKTFIYFFISFILCPVLIYSLHNDRPKIADTFLTPPSTPTSYNQQKGRALISRGDTLENDIEVGIVKKDRKALDTVPDDKSIQKVQALKSPVIDNSYESIHIEPAEMGVIEKDSLPILEVGMVNVTKDVSGFAAKSINNLSKRLALQFDKSKLPAGYSINDVHTFWFNKRSSHWLQLKRDSLDVTNNIVYSTTSEDGDYINAIIKVPEAPEAQGYVPTTMSDIKVGDPGSMVQVIEAPTPNSQGSANLSYHIETPPGRQGLQPDINVVYNNEGGSGILGEGWSLSGMSSVTVDTRWGVPQYEPSKETETYLLDGQMLITRDPSNNEAVAAHRKKINRKDDRTFYVRRESNFNKIVRTGNSTATYRWVITDKAGTKYYYGGISQQDAVLGDASKQRIAEWKLRKVEDLFGNSIEYRYEMSDFEASGNNVQTIYPKEILYTKSTKSTTLHLYKVEMKYDNQLNRSDVTFNARYGFLTSANNKWLSEIVVRFVKYTGSDEEDDYTVNNPIRKYKFDYKDGEYGKLVLEKISQFGFGGGGNPILFNSHTVRYFTMKDFAGNYFAAAKTINSPQNDFLGGSKTVPKIGVGAAIGIGAMDGNMASKSLSADGQFSYKESGSEGQSSLVDINGDGLPDLVYKRGEGLKYKANTTKGDNISFGSEMNLNNVENFSKDNGSSIGGGWQVNGPTGSRVFIGGDYNTSRTYTNVYFTDANGDGLLDIADNGIVKFNTGPKLDGSIDFVSSSANTGNPLTKGDGIDANLKMDNTTKQNLTNYNIQVSPLHDVIKIWIAPDSGTVNIDAPIKLLQPIINPLNIEDSIKYKKADGIVYSIQKNKELIVPATLIGKSDASVVVRNVLTAKVRKNDKIIFRLQSGNETNSNGDFDEVSWNPTISYTSKRVDKHVIDLFGQNRLHFNAVNDFLPSNGMFALPDSGSFTIKSLLKKPLTADSIFVNVYAVGNRITGSLPDTLITVKRNSQFRTDTTKTIADTTYTLHRYSYGLKDTLLFKQGYDTSARTIDINIGEVDYKRNTKVYFELSGASNLNFKSVTWLPKIAIHHIDTADHSASGPWKNDTSVCYPNTIFKGNLFRSGTVYIPRDSGDVIIYPRVRLNAAVRSTIKLVISDTTKVIAKKLISDSASADQAIVITRNRNQPFFVHYEMDNLNQIDTISPLGIIPTIDASFTDYSNWTVPKSGSYSFFAKNVGELRRSKYRKNGVLSVAVNSDTLQHLDLNEGDIISFIDTTNTVKTLPFRVLIPEGAAIFSNWSTLDFGNLYRGWGQAIFKGMDNLKSAIDPALLKAEDQQKNNLSDVKFFGMALDDKTKFLKGPNEREFIKGDTLSSSRLAMPDVEPVDVFDFKISVNANGAVAVSKYTSNSGSSYAASVLGLTGNSATGNAQIISDYQDMNGDRYPDVMGEKYIQYTDAQGGLSGVNARFNYPILQISDNNSKGLNLGGNFDHSQPINNQSKSQQVKSVAEASASTALTLSGLSGGGNYNNDITDQSLNDINGDGLPDIVTNNSVKLNLGYGFSDASINWQINDLQKNRSETVSFGGGVNIDNYSFSAGINLAQTTSEQLSGLIDLNGDGLADQVTLTPGGLAVRWNLGSVIAAAPVMIPNITSITKSEANSQGINGSYTFAPWIFLTPLKAVFSFSANTAFGSSATKAQLVDINGDGYLDFVQTAGNSVTISLSNLGKINKVDTVFNPLGGKLLVDYKHIDAGLDHPGGKWVMASIIKSHGVSDDGADSKITYDYQNGVFDRYEREFLGFGRVIQTETIKGDPYRRTIQEYDSKNYYTANNVLRSWTEDAIGNIYNFEENIYQLRLRSNLASRTTTVIPVVSKFFSGLVQTPLIAKNRYAYEGSKTRKILLNQTEYAYDTLLNVISMKFREGSTTTPNKTVYTTRILYDRLDPNNNVYGLPVKMEVLDTTGTTLKKIAANYPWKFGPASNSKNYYRKIQSDTVFFNAQTFAVTKYEYDDYGNLQNKTFADNFNYAYEYEDKTEALISEINDDYFEKNVFKYDYRFAIDTLRLLTNGTRIRTRVDEFGRVDTISGPGQLSPDPGNKSYTIAVTYNHQASTPYAIVKHFDPLHTGTNEGIYTINFIDGFKKSIQVKKTGVVNGTLAWIVDGRKKYDELERVVATYYPTTENYTITNGVIDATGKTYNPAVSNVRPQTFQYDVMNRLLSDTLQDGKVFSKYKYTIAKDGFGRDALVTISSFTEDERVNRKDVFTNGSGLVSTEVYYKDTSAASAKKIVKYQYDPVHQLKSVSHVLPTGREITVIKSEFDWSGKRNSYNNISGGTTNLYYDAVGNVNMRVTPNRDTIAYNYLHNRLISIDYPKHREDSVRYVYGNIEGNNHGRIVFQTDASGSQSFKYDEYGNIIANTRSIIAPYDSFYTFTTLYNYDTWGRLNYMVYPGGEKVNYGYLQDGKLTRVAGSKFGSTIAAFPYVNSITYDEFESRKSIDFGNGMSTTYKYELERRRLQEVQTKKGPTSVMKNSYTYDGLNNITSINNVSTTQNGLMGVTMTHNYTYSNMNQISTARGKWGSNQTYDLRMSYDDQLNIGNKYMEVVSPTITRRTNSVYSYNNNNPMQLNNTHESEYRKSTIAGVYNEANTDYHTYDNNGNDIIMSTADSFQNNVYERRIIWDAENRMRAISTNGYVSSYGYDADGNRTFKLSTETDGVFVNGRFAEEVISPATYSLYANPFYSVRNGNGIGTKHIYIGTERIVSQLTNETNWPTNTGAETNMQPFRTPVQLNDATLVSPEKFMSVDYEKKMITIDDLNNLYFDSLHLSHRSIKHGAFKTWPRLQYTAAINPAKSNDTGRVINSVSADEQLQYFYHANHLGSTSFISDRTGNVVQYVEYLPFGETFIEDRKDYSSQYLFNGKEQDQETGLYYYGTRYYDAHTYQWLSVDPMAEKYVSLSPFTFSNNNPLVMRDPDGSEPKSAVDWTNSNALYYAMTRYTGFDKNYIFEKKAEFIKAYSNEITNAALKNGIDPFLLAGVGFTEYGGKTFEMKSIVLETRELINQHTSFPELFGKLGVSPEKTSFGDFGIQIRRAREVIDLSGMSNEEVANYLRDPTNSINAAAKYLKSLSGSINSSSVENIMNVANQYNTAPGKQGDQSYGRSIFKHVKEINNALNGNENQ